MELLFVVKPLFGQAQLRRIGRELRALRHRAGLSQAALGEAAGVSSGAIRALEAGRSNPTLSTMVSIVETLGTTLDALVAEACGPAPVFDLTKAADTAKAPRTRLSRTLPRPGMQALIVQVDSVGQTCGFGGEAVFAHVLAGSFRARLDREEFLLGPGDSLHARAGVTGSLVAEHAAARLLLVSAAERPQGPVAGRHDNRGIA